MFSATIFAVSPCQKHFVYQGVTPSPISSVFVSTTHESTTLSFSCTDRLSAQVESMLLHENRFLFQRNQAGTISIMAVLERFDLIVCALHKLSCNKFVAASFAQEIIENYPNQFGGVMHWSPAVPETTDEEPVHDAKRQRI